MLSTFKNITEIVLLESSSFPVKFVRGIAV